MTSCVLANGKGGSCKTVSALSLGAVLAREGAKVLLVDLDPQATLSRCLEGTGKAMRKVLAGKIEPDEAARPTDYDGLCYVPSNRSLEKVESTRGAKLTGRLQALLESAEEDGFDWVLIDPPPATGRLMTSALLAAEHTLSPVEAGLPALDGLGDTLQLIRKIGGAPLLGAFACRVDARTNADTEAAEYMKDQLGPERSFETVIRETVKVREAMRDGVPLPYYAPTCTAAEDYQTLADELKDRTR